MTEDIDESDGPRGLRRAAEAGQRAKAENLELRRENALLRAGVDLDSPLGALFAKGYDGDPSDDAIREAWAEVHGAVPPTPEVPMTPDPHITADERASTAQRQALANGSPADLPPGPADPRDEADRIREAVVASGGRAEDGVAAALDHILGAATRGDHRVLIKPPPA